MASCRPATSWEGNKIMVTINEILSGTRRTLIATRPEATVRQATRLMNDHGIGSLLVTRDGRLIGIFTERDVLRRIVAEGRSPDTTTVGEVMTGDVFCCPPQASIEEVADLMRRRRVRHVPIVDAADTLVGLVSIGDVNAHRFAVCATELVQMRDYIMNRA
jgi:CBS domain-containing protein